MSAIYGAIDLNKRAVSSAILDKFNKEYSDCRIDRYESKSIENGFMACGIQHITALSPKEHLPVYDEKRGILFTADCLLDNREAIIKDLCDNWIDSLDDTLTKLAVSVDDKYGNNSNTSFQLSVLSDGALIYLLYLLWGRDFAGHLRGIFSLVIYDISANSLMLFADQFATRSLFYHIRDGVIYFSTLLKPLINASGLAFDINERWLTDAISIRGPIMMTEEIECAYENVFKVNSGHYVVISTNATSFDTISSAAINTNSINTNSINSDSANSSTVYFSHLCYFDPVNSIKVNHKLTDSEAARQIHDALSNSVRNCINTASNVAIMQSSGLDSTTIAGLAAPMLKEEGKRLYAYTSVPENNEKINNDDSYYLTDESSLVKDFISHHSNMELKLISCPGKSILSEADKLLDIWELPCKSQQNAVWTNEIFEKAMEDNCRVVLTGAIGNTTISAGEIFELLYEDFSHFRFLSFYRDFTCYFNKYHGIKKDFLKRFLKSIFTYRLSRILGKKYDYYKYTATREDVGERHNIEKRYEGEFDNFAPFSGFKNLHSKIYLTLSYAQIGEINTKNSLRYGVIERDPCRNVEVIETLLSFPMRMFVNGDFDRRIIREFMADAVPDNIRLNVSHRGRQSADNTDRIIQVLPEYLDQIKDLIYSEKALRFLDKDKLDLFFKDLNEENYSEWNGDLLLLMDLYMFSKYLYTL